MHKLFILAVMLLFSVDGSAKEPVNKTKFLNPAFYEMLDPISRTAWKTWLTPTKRISENSVGFRTEEDCELIENKWMSITLKCYYSIEDNDVELVNPYSIDVYTLSRCLKTEGCYYGGRYMVKQKSFSADTWERIPQNSPKLQSVSIQAFIID